MNRPTIVTVTGPSGSGKSTLERKLVGAGGFSRVVSTTTRARRPGESDGIDYHFVSPEQFADEEQSGQFIETVSFGGARYGASRNSVEDIFARGNSAVIVVEPKGQKQIRFTGNQLGWSVISVFIDGHPLALTIRQIVRAGRELGTSYFHSDEDFRLSVEALARRLHLSYTSENRWREEAWEAFNDSDDPTYDLVFPSFDESNQDNVVGTIQAAVVENALLCGLPLRLAA